MKFNTLYGKSKSGKLKEWNISVRQMGDGTCYIETEHGYADGKKQLDSRYVGEGKNIGRANETTIYEQACSEAKSSHSKKKDEGYVEDKTKIPSTSDGLFLPMLAHRYDKYASKIKFPCYTQVKYDGLRLLARKEDGVVTIWSRKGKPLDVLENIRSQLELFLDEGQCTDGEVYVHGWTFQRIISAAKKQRPDTDLLEYHIYDLPHTSLPFEERMITHTDDGEAIYTEHNQNFEYGLAKAPNVIVAKASLAKTENELGEHEAAAIKDSYEGLMARNVGSPYVYKNRSYSLQKIKRFISDEYEVVGFTDGDGRESGLVVWRCITDSGDEFGVRPKGTHERRAELFKNGSKYIGEKLTVQFFELSDDGVPRFPVGIGLRPEWDMS
jgi:DNA ligase-1